MAAGTRKTLKPRWNQIYGVQLDNYFPERGKVQTRRGSTQYALTGGTTPVQSLFNWVSGADDKLFAFSDTNLYDVTDPAVVTEVSGVTVTEGRWRGVNMNGQGILVNGTDEPLRIDGTGAWVAHGFSGTGLTVANLNQVAVFKNRMFFLEKDSPNLWYGDLNAITGTLNKINLGLVNEMGGNCIAMPGHSHLTQELGWMTLLAIFMSRGTRSCLRWYGPLNSQYVANFRYFPPWRSRRRAGHS